MSSYFHFQSSKSAQRVTFREENIQCSIVKFLTCRNFLGLKGDTDCSTASQYKALRDIKDDISFLFTGTFLFE